MSSSNDSISATDTGEDIADDVSDEIAEKVVDLMSPSLESMTPVEAVDKYFERVDIKPSTVQTQESSLYNFFVEWCNEVAEIEEMSALTGNDLANYRTWRRDEASDRVDKLGPKSEETQQKITRSFIKRCESWEVVSADLHEYVIVPDIDKHDEVRDVVLDSERAEEILQWLEKYQYASIQHVVWMLLAACGARVGGIHSLDLGDFEHEDADSRLKFRHRESTGTFLKNDEGGERNVSLSESHAEVLKDYVDDKRVEQTDEYGREPLLTSKQGRLAKTTMRNYIYAYTRPCSTGKECPHGKDEDECEAARRKNWAHKCPDSMSCHPVRKGYITSELSSGVPKKILSDRCDMTEAVMEKHYDYRSEEERREARKSILQAARESGEGYAE